MMRSQQTFHFTDGGKKVLYNAGDLVEDVQRRGDQFDSAGNPLQKIRIGLALKASEESTGSMWSSGMSISVTLVQWMDGEQELVSNKFITKYIPG